MRFKVDENLPAEVAGSLRGSGHDAVTVPEQRCSGAADAWLAALCQREDRILLTLDMDFADIRAYPPAAFPGLIVLRLARQDKPHVLGIVASLIEVLRSESPQGTLWIVGESRIRIRE